MTPARKIGEGAPQAPIAEWTAETAGVPGATAASLFAAIPVPNTQSVRLLLEGLERIGQLEWVREAEAGGFWPAVDWLTAAIPKLPSGSFAAEAPELASIKDKYEVYSALVDKRHRPPRWLEAARAILILAAWQWRGKHITAQRDLASALRALQYKGRESTPVARELAKLGDAKSLISLITLAAGLDHGSQTQPRTFWNTWARRIVPMLEAIRDAMPSLAPPPALPLPTPTTDLPSGPTPDKGSGRGKRPVRKKLRPPRTFSFTARPDFLPRELRAEAPQDSGTFVSTYDVPSAVGASREQRRIELFRASQSIWSANTLLLADHYDTLCRTEARLLGDLVAEKVASGDVDTARQFARLGLSLATGRTGKLLAKGHIGSLTDAGDDKAWLLDPVDAGLAQLVPRPPEAFEPDAAESTRLQVVGDVLAVKPAQGMASLMGEAVRRKLPLIGPVEEMERDIKAACRAATDVLGFAITPGRVRRTLSRLLQDSGRDVVKTMLITGDTFGWSIAPLYYVSPRISDLQELYLEVTAAIFGGDVPNVPISTERVGARLLRTDSARREPEMALEETLAARLESPPGAERARLVHAGVVDYFVSLLLEAGHRPVDALFRLRRDDFDLRGQGAIFQDKALGKAITSRFAAIPDVLVRQAKAYLRHLSALEEFLDASGRRHVRKVLAGDAPLFFDLEASGSVKPLRFSDWHARLPAACRHLPPNAGRTTVATRGRELGADPEALLTQLGHQEAAGFPFSESSPTVPLHLAQHVAPTLDRISSEAGWRCRDGLAGRDSKDVACSGVIYDWTARLKNHEKEQHDALRSARDSLRSKSREARKQAGELVSNAIAGAAPLLHGALYSGADRGDIEILDQKAVASLQACLLDQVDGDPVLAYAVMHTLRNRLNFARKKWQWAGFVPFRWKVARRDEGTPFFPGMMLAREQLECLRDAYAQVSPKAPGGIDETTWAFARTALALMLFGFVERKEELYGILEARGRLRRMANLPEVVLVQWNDAPPRVTAVEGVAPIALGALAWHYPDSPVPDDEKMQAAILRMLPRGWAFRGANLIQSLLSTVSVANRIELSGASRMAANPETGARDAKADAQVAWLDNDPPRLQGAATPVEPREDAGVKAIARIPAKGTESAKKQYERLLANFPSTESGSSLPLTGETITAADIGRSKQKLIAEFEATASLPESSEVIVALSCWAVEMLRNGTEGTADPALGTVKKYLSTVGSELVPLVQGRRMTNMPDEDLTATLQDVVELKKTDDSKRLAAREVGNFYRVAASAMSLPEVDLSEIAYYASQDTAGADGELICSSEVNASLASLKGEANNTPIYSPEEVRLRRQAVWALSLMRATGARSGEVFGSRLRDLQLVGHDTFFRVLRNRHRRLKTPSAKRRYALTHRLTGAVRERLHEWRDAEQARLPEWAQANAYSIAHMDSGRDLSPRQEVRDLVAESLAASTGRPSERLHRVRHLVASETLLWTFMSPAQRSSMNFLWPLSDTANEDRVVLFPRDLARHTTLLGHAKPHTTICAYMHFAWALRLRSNAWISQRTGRRTAAAALGISPGGASRITQRNSNRSQALAWLDHVVGPRAKPDVDVTTQSPVVTVDLVVAMDKLKLSDLMRIIEWTERGSPLSSAGLSAGASADQIELVRAAAQEYRTQTGVTFADAIDVAERNRPRVRRNSINKHLYGLLGIMEAPDATPAPSRAALLAVANAHFMRARVRHRDAIILPAPETTLLRNLLLKVGHPGSLIHTEPVDGGPLLATRVRRKEGSKLFAGLELKRLLGVVWVRERARDLARFQSA